MRQYTIKSMTGMGKAAGSVLGVPVRIELKSVNHRFCEVNFKAPQRYFSLEFSVQKFLREMFSRGRIDVLIFEERSVALAGFEKKAYQSCYKQLVNVRRLLKINAEVTLEHVLSGVNAWMQKDADPQKMWRDFSVVLEKAAKDLDRMRRMEGSHLARHLSQLLLSLEKITDKIDGERKNIKQKLEEKLSARLAEKKEKIAGLDDQRLHAEVVFYLDRMDIEEEVVRLRGHLAHAQALLREKEPVGRKLDFLLQEFNREFNTLGAKCQDTLVSRDVVEAKSYLEKLKEQVQNIE